MMYLYDEKFFSDGQAEIEEIAQIIMKYVVERLHPRSIVDFGCGEGIWLSVVKQLNSNIEILGVDGDYINRGRLKIPVDCFYPANLEEKLELDHKYDLAISFEVAEHLNEGASDVFVETITQAAESILFSAAIPGQGGCNHINEQWQSYWIEKFIKKGYSVDTSIRDYFWDEERITPWRRQNILFFSRNKKSFFCEKREIYDVVHPQMFAYRINNERMGQGVKDVYCQIDEKINSLIRKGEEKIVIYPFGQNGYLCKEILNYKYHVKELAIVDNYQCKINSNIIPARQLRDIMGEYCILDNCNNPKVHKELLDELKKHVYGHEIYTVFEEES